MKKILCVCLVLSMLCAGLGHAESANGSGTMALQPLDALPEAGWQSTVSFPDWKG